MGIFNLIQYRAGRKIGTRIAHNDHTHDGVRHLMSCCGSLGPRINDRVIGFIDDVGYSAIAITDTATSHPGWVEASQARVLWPRQINSGLTLNPLPVETIGTVQVTITADADFRGLFITTSVYTPEILVATALFADVLSVKTDDLLVLTYETAFQTPWP